MVVVTRRQTLLVMRSRMTIQILTETNAVTPLKKKMKNRRTSTWKNSHKASSPASEACPALHTKQNSPSGVVKRRPIRPIDRQKMRDWLLDKLEGGQMSEQLSWLDKDKGTFCVTWCHAARHGYEVTQHAPLFKAWALHTEKFKEGDEENHKTWKANFRCALHSVPDIKELTKDGERKGKTAKRVYQLLDKPAVAKKPRKGRRGKKSLDFTEGVEVDPAEESDSGVSTGDNMGSPATPSLPDNVPDFRQLGISTVAGATTTTFTSSRHASGGCVTVSQESDSQILSPLPTLTISEGSNGISVSGMEAEMDDGQQQTVCPVRMRCLSGDSGNYSSSGNEEEFLPEDTLLLFLDEVEQVSVCNGEPVLPWNSPIAVEADSAIDITEESVITENVDTCTDERYTSLSNVPLEDELSLRSDIMSHPLDTQ